MSLHVQRQVVTPGEAALADDALERFRAGVLPVVPRQLVGPRETPLALGPLTGVRFFTRVDSLMGFQVGAFGVDFCATNKITVMYPPLLQLRIVPPVVPSDDVLHNSDTTQNTVDAVLRGPLPDRSRAGTTPTTTCTATTVTTTATVSARSTATTASRSTCGYRGRNNRCRRRWYRVTSLQVWLRHLRLRSVRNDAAPVGMTLAGGHQVELLLLLVVIRWGWSSAGWILQSRSGTSRVGVRRGQWRDVHEPRDGCTNGGSTNLGWWMILWVVHLSCRGTTGRLMIGRWPMVVIVVVVIHLQLMVMVVGLLMLMGLMLLR